MRFKLILILTVMYYTNCEKTKLSATAKPKTVQITKIAPDLDSMKNVPKDNNINITVNKENKLTPSKIVPVLKVQKAPVIKKDPKPVIPLETIQEWAATISQKILQTEQHVVRRDLLMKSFSDVKMEVRDGAAIVDKMAVALEDLLGRRAKAVENIRKKAEELADNKTPPPSLYKFDQSLHLDVLKKEETLDLKERNVLPVNCTRLRKLPLHDRTHFGSSAKVSLDETSVHVVAEVFPCDKTVMEDLYWSEGLLETFQQNYAQDSMLDFQYFCSAKGFLRHYPAAAWSSMFSLSLNPTDDLENGVADVYDCRLRPWYVGAGGAPRDVLILFDDSGSMTNSTNKVHAEHFTLALLSALTDDDHVNVIRFNTEFQSPISCLNDRLVPANHVNSAAMMATMKLYKTEGPTNLTVVLNEAVTLLHEQRAAPDRPTSCQQAIVLLVDSLEYNYTDLVRELDPDRHIRVFVIWLHDPFGLSDNSQELGQWLSCTTDGYYAELTTNADVTQQVTKILRVLERPLVAQRNERLTVFSDIYAHVEDPRRSEHLWRDKENAEQVYRYNELRRDKRRLLSPDQLYKDYMHLQSLVNDGQYYEGQDLDYRLQISVSMPVFESTTTENITITLFEEKQRNSTRTYPVNRLLGVAGVDIPIEHLKLILPYHQLGAGGSLFIFDHRGNIVLHDNIKPTFEGNILRPGYRTVDILELEQPGAPPDSPRKFPPDWLEFRRTMVIDQSKGNKTMQSKHIFEDGMRATLEPKEYHWRRVLNHYTAVVALPTKYSRRRAVFEGSFTLKLAASASEALLRSEFSVHPDWLYCRHVDPYFDERHFEVRHFISRRKEEPNFQMQNLKHAYSPIKFVPLMEKAYQCNEELMTRLCKDVIATSQWANDEKHDPPSSELGSTTAFFATESGLTRWRQYRTISQHAEPPNGDEWPRGPTEPWYKRAAMVPGKLVVHAPVTPIRKLRNSDQRPPALGVRHKWLTAARTVGHPDKVIGVAGYHFHPQHLEDLFKAITVDHDCKADQLDCKPHCDGKNWTCVLVDDGGWVVAGHIRDEEEISEEDPAREHLSRVHPQVMSALLSASVFKLHWIHDYQAVCFPPFDEKLPSAAPTMPSLLTSLRRLVNVMFHVTRELVTILTVLSTGCLAGGDTEFEKQKRRKRLWKDNERDKYERLYDPLVLVNRTRFTACDRSRAFYVLQRDIAMKVLKKPTDPTVDPCSWPLVGALVPETNLLLLAIDNNCTHGLKSPNDPFVNQLVNMSDSETWNKSSATQLACWRNRVPLPARPPHVACYPHEYKHEEGYRQCGPWLPDPEPENTANTLRHYIGIVCVGLIIYLCS